MSAIIPETFRLPQHTCSRWRVQEVVVEIFFDSIRRPRVDLGLALGQRCGRFGRERGHAGANASNIQALLPILALDAVARGLPVWRSREKRYSARHRFEEAVIRKIRKNRLYNTYPVILSNHV